MFKKSQGFLNQNKTYYFIQSEDYRTLKFENDKFDESMDIQKVLEDSKFIETLNDNLKNGTRLCFL